MNFDLGRLAFVAKLTKHPGVVQDSFLAGGARLCSRAAICLAEGPNIRQSSFGALGVRGPAALMDVGTQREREQGGRPAHSPIIPPNYALNAICRQSPGYLALYRPDRQFRSRRSVPGWPQVPLARQVFLRPHRQPCQLQLL